MVPRGSERLRGTDDPHHAERFLHTLILPKTHAEKLAANGHYDAGAFAFAVCESAPGLMVGTQAVKDETGAVTPPRH